MASELGLGTWKVTGSLCDQEGGAGSEKEEVLSELAAPTSSLLVSLDQAMAPPRRGPALIFPTIHFQG